jgi:hypothetical protein
MHIGLYIVSTKCTSKLKFWIPKTGSKRTTRTSITQLFSSKSVEGLIMFFKWLLDVHSLIFRTGLSLISPCQCRMGWMIAHSSVCFILRTTMAGIEKWTFKLRRLALHISHFLPLLIPSHPFTIAIFHSLHFVIMYLFCCVSSRIKYMCTRRSFCTT